MDKDLKLLLNSADEMIAYLDQVSSDHLDSGKLFTADDYSNSAHMIKRLKDAIVSVMRSIITFREGITCPYCCSTDSYPLAVSGEDIKDDHPLYAECTNCGQGFDIQLIVKTQTHAIERD